MITCIVNKRFIRTGWRPYTPTLLFRFIFFLFTCFSCVGNGQGKTDSLSKLIKANKADSNTVRHLLRLSKQFYAQSDIQNAITYGDSAIAIAQRLEFLKGYADACSLTGSFYAEREKYTKAMNCFSSAMKVYAALDDKNGIAMLKNHLGAFYAFQNDNSKALAYFMDALKMETETGNQTEVANITGNIGVLYTKIGEYDKALHYTLMALRIYEKGADSYNLTNTLTNIGILYFIKKEYNKALDCYTQSIKIEEKNNYRHGMAGNILNIGEVYLAYGVYFNSLKHYESALKIYTEIQDTLLEGIALGNIGLVYLKQKKYPEAEKYLLMARDAAKKTGDIPGIKETNKNLSDLYAKAGQLQKALDSYKSYIAAKDSLVNEHQNKEIGHLEARAEYEKQIELQKASEVRKSELNEAESKRQKIFILLIATVALAAILIAISIFRLLKTTRREKLFAEKQKVIQELIALRSQMNPHFIFNAINSIKSIVMANDSLTASKHLTTFSKLIREVLENSKRENIPLAKELHMLKLYLELESLRFSYKFSYSIRVDESIDPEVVLISPLLIQPYVENAIWHGIMHLEDRRGELKIRIEKTNTHALTCIIDDNGIGRERSAEIRKGKIYQSLGLSITAERLEIINSLHKNNIHVHFTDKKNENGLPAGTCVELFLPLLTHKPDYA